MKPHLALFDLDHTLINADSDNTWPQYLMQKGVVDAEFVRMKNDKFYQDYLNGCLDIDEFLQFQLAPLTRFSMEELADMHREFTQAFILPHISPMAKMLVQSHRQTGDELLVISSTNEFIITPICHLFGIENIIGTQLEIGENGLTGREACMKVLTFTYEDLGRAIGSTSTPSIFASGL